MKAVIQRVSKAGVSIEGSPQRTIKHGMVVLLGVGHDDSEEDVRWLANKIITLRIFSEKNTSLAAPRTDPKSGTANSQSYSLQTSGSRGHFDRSIQEIGGEILVISQFTLYADCRKGRRPDLTAAAKPDFANKLYQMFIEVLRETADVNVITGEFGALMQVEIHNDGPVTIILEK